MIKRFRFLSEEPRLHVGPLRVTYGEVLRDMLPSPHRAIVVEWFADLAALHAHEHEHGTPDEPTFVGEPEVARGADWLARNEPTLKHMALARRHQGFTAEEFATRWRAKAGTAAGLVIPERARGCAYVQNHMREPRPGYDAVNEVYFDDLDALRERIAFFREHAVGQDDELVAEASFVVVSERVIARGDA